MTKALEAFERTIVSRDAPYDRYVHGDANALELRAVRGMKLFFGRLGCASCHGGTDFNHASSAAVAEGAGGDFANTGLYNVDGRGGYPTHDRGLVTSTGDEGDEGRFRIPSLRNVALTAPYMHDGSVSSLDDVLTAYARGGRYLASDPYPGDGATSPRKHPALRGFELGPDERADVIAFLNGLTDTTLTSRDDLSNPF